MTSRSSKKIVALSVVGAALIAVLIRVRAGKHAK